jgi:GTP-binding protein YchF
VEFAIVGLPGSGKTTIFNAVTGGTAQVGSYGTQARPNVGVAKVPDPRLDVLTGIFGPKRTVPAEIAYVDVPAAGEARGSDQGVAGELLNHLQRADALLVVARAFDDPSVPSVEDTVDLFRDLETTFYELTFADLAILDRRLVRVADGFKGARAPERDALTKEQELLSRIKADVEEEVAVRQQVFDRDETRLLAGFQLLTAKPLIAVANVGERELDRTQSLEEQVSSRLGCPHVGALALCGSLEMELAEMDETDQPEFRESMGLGESGLDRMVGKSYEVMDLITFYTGNANEVRAWPIRSGSTALEAAGKVHSDFVRGFIRAETIAFDDLSESGGFAEARRQGLLRQEGKSYVVKDRDVINVLFNV